MSLYNCFRCLAHLMTSLVTCVLANRNQADSSGTGWSFCKIQCYPDILTNKDANGSDSEKIRNENGIQETTTYEYDGLKRLTKETVESSVTDTYSGTAVSSATDIYSYSYDDYSNRIKMTVSGSENYTVDYNYNDSEGYKALLRSLPLNSE